MIRKQYIRYDRGYFGNFLNTMDDGSHDIDEELKKYNATIAKAKNENYKINVKWHDPKLYTWFVLRWS